jgi:hypothetical protein
VDADVLPIAGVLWHTPPWTPASAGMTDRDLAGSQFRGEIAIKRVFTTKEVLGVLISLSFRYLFEVFRYSGRLPIRISMQGNLALSPLLTGPRVLLPRDAASNYGSMHITPSH